MKRANWIDISAISLKLLRYITKNLEKSMTASNVQNNHENFRIASIALDFVK